MSDEMTRGLIGIKSRLGNVESRLGHVESRLGHVESRLGNVESRLGNVEDICRRLAVGMAQLTGKVSDLERTIAKADLGSLRSDIQAKLDGFARQSEDSRYRWAIHADTLVRHDKRLKKLEARHS